MSTPIYHLHVSTGQKSTGQSALAKNNYICREGKYSSGSDELQFSDSGNMPAWSENKPEKYWEAADIYSRDDARLFREVEFALPANLTEEEQNFLALKFCHLVAKKFGVPYSMAVHRGQYDHYGNRSSTPDNPHCHLILSECINDGIDRTPQTWFRRANKKNPERGGALKNREMKHRDFVTDMRQLWQDVANEALSKYNQRIDCRTLAAQGIDRIPQVHVGVEGWHMYREKGLVTNKMAHNMAIIAANQQRAEQRRAVAQLDRQISDLDSEIKKANDKIKSAQLQAEQARREQELKIEIERQQFNALPLAEQYRKWYYEYQPAISDQIETISSLRERLWIEKHNIETKEKEKEKLDKWIDREDAELDEIEEHGKHKNWLGLVRREHKERLEYRDEQQEKFLDLSDALKQCILRVKKLEQKIEAENCKLDRLSKLCPNESIEVEYRSHLLKKLNDAGIPYPDLAKAVTIANNEFVNDPRNSKSRRNSSRINFYIIENLEHALEYDDPREARITTGNTSLFPTLRYQLDREREKAARQQREQARIEAYLKRQKRNKGPRME